ncbi:MAG: Fur family transcriptional regulator [Rhodospirillales bacterium]|tara:strand:+ start:768 stop:1193 length:426 start_codon:yes stop_codon:yes gene_type:complete
MADHAHHDGPALTRNQQAVLTALKGADKPLTAYDVLGLPAIRKAGMKAPLTIYRALDKLIDRGLVHRIESLNAFVHCGHGPHDHATGFLICTDCGRTLEVHLEACETHLAGRARDQGFAVDDVRVEMTGRCPDCARQAAAP